MNRLFARLLAGMLAVWTLPVCAFALQSNPTDGNASVYHDEEMKLSLYDAEGRCKTSARPLKDTYLFEVAPGQTLYLPLGLSGQSGRYTVLCGRDSDQANDKSRTASSAELADPAQFELGTDAWGKGSDLVQIDQCGELHLGGDTDALLGGRGAWLKVEIDSSAPAKLLEPSVDLLFTAKKDSATYRKGDYAELRLAFRLSGEKKDAAADGRYLFRPVIADTGALVWENMADLLMTDVEEAADLKISTRPDEALAERHEAANLYFRSFTGGEELGCRAILTLLNPYWKEGASTVSPDACHIYTMDGNGELLDVTSLFTYLSADEDGNAVNGWRVRTRTLGNFVLSDRELTD